MCLGAEWSMEQLRKGALSESDLWLHGRAEAVAS